MAGARDGVVAALVVLFVLLCGCAAMKGFTCAQPQPFPDNSAVSLDWQGTYRGTVPCADCEGIETSITLNHDLTYTVKTKYLGKDEKVFEQRGTFAWNEAGSAIVLDDASGDPNRYLVGENALFQLDGEGNRITGDLAEKYVLRKIAAAAPPAPEILSANSPWRLVELVGEAVAPPSEGGEAPFLVFEPEGGRIHGFGGCNYFFGQCEYMPGGRLRFSKIASTKKSCPDMAVESEFLKILENTDNYFTDGKALKLHRAKMAPLAVLVSSAAPDSVAVPDPGNR
jgi:uncharacterized lipoprotein NlpE involved in copper resistance